MALSNNPPVELSREDAEFVAAMLERDLFQGLAILQRVQRFELSEEAAKKAVDFMEAARPIFNRIKEQLGE